MTNYQVVQAFWTNSDKPCHSRSLSYKDGKLLSYDTCILQRVNGMVFGNYTQYSSTTSRHQSQARIYDADKILYGVPVGTSSLLFFAEIERDRLDDMIKKALS